MAQVGDGSYRARQLGRQASRQEGGRAGMDGWMAGWMCMQHKCGMSGVSVSTSPKP